MCNIHTICASLNPYTQCIYKYEAEFKEKFHIHALHDIDYVSFSTSTVVILLITDLNEYYRKYITLDSFMDWYDSL